MLDELYPIRKQAKLQLLATAVYPMPAGGPDPTASPSTVSTQDDSGPCSSPPPEQPTPQAVSKAVRFVAYGGSILEYLGGAIVNAANTGGVGGKGLDEMVNKACGGDIVAARRALRGINEGEAKSTPSFDHKKVKHIIHAVGPTFHHPGSRTAPPKKKGELTPEAVLAAAYTNALLKASELKSSSVGFCLLSAGLFRGPKTTAEVIRIGLDALKAAVAQLVADEKVHVPKEIAIVAFSGDEQKDLAAQFCDVFVVAASK